MQYLKFTKSKVRLIAISAIGCLILPLILWPLATKQAVTPNGKGALEFLIFSLIFIPLFLLIAAGGILSTLGLLSKSVRPSALLWFFGFGLCMTCYMGGCFAGGAISKKIQNKALEQIVERAKPLIGAIKSYELKNGHPPESLEKIVPEFIAQIPTTGIGVSLNYRYERQTNASTSYGTNQWILEVHNPAESDPLSFNTLLYLPSEDYSVLRYGQVNKRKDGWAYWHRG